ncbi:N-6 DNA methylase [Pseudomonas sp. NPDC089569]|uniref:N-6 DNA methylase n=1 Tax=Pseudomonas sp. NPDC089569 TaxID=3390722 RepID=UPI003D061DD0
MPNAQQHIKSMVQLIDTINYVSRREVFADFVEMGAIAYSNGIDLRLRVNREARYLKLIGKYQKKHQHIFGDLLAELTMAMESEPSDILGRLFHELDAANKATGQFFTPPHICELMGKLIVGCGSQIKAEIEERGFFRLSEPSCGSAAMVIAFATAIRELGINYQQNLHVTLTDIDARAVHMAYLHLSLMHIPAIVVHGNTLTLEEFGSWRTPAHFTELFEFKLRRGYSLESAMGRGQLALESEPAEELTVTTEHLFASHFPVHSLTEQASLF